MQEVELFEYAVIRLVPRVEREEFINIGVILYCRGQRFLQMRYTLDASRYTLLFPDVDVADLHSYLAAFQQVCEGRGGDITAIAALPPAERFRWLTAKRSTMIQTSAVHPGRCADAAAALDRLYSQLVG